MHRFSEAHDGPLAEFLLDLLQGDVKGSSGEQRPDRFPVMIVPLSESPEIWNVEKATAGRRAIRLLSSSHKTGGGGRGLRQPTICRRSRSSATVTVRIRTVLRSPGKRRSYTRVSPRTYVAM